MPKDERLPLQALRDLIGVCRGLYAAWIKRGAGPIELEELRGVGQELSSAFELARKCAPDTIGYRAARARAEAATRRLGELVRNFETSCPIVVAAAGRVVSGDRAAPSKPGPSDERAAKKHHARMRS
jgi:hypothetical protein